LIADLFAWEVQGCLVNPTYDIWKKKNLMSRDTNSKKVRITVEEI